MLRYRIVTHSCIIIIRTPNLKRNIYAYAWAFFRRPFVHACPARLEYAIRNTQPPRHWPVGLG